MRRKSTAASPWHSASGTGEVGGASASSALGRKTVGTRIARNGQFLYQDSNRDGKSPATTAFLRVAWGSEGVQRSRLKLGLDRPLPAVTVMAALGGGTGRATHISTSPATQIVHRCKALWMPGAALASHPRPGRAGPCLWCTGDDTWSGWLHGKGCTTARLLQLRHRTARAGRSCCGRALRLNMLRPA